MAIFCLQKNDKIPLIGSKNFLLKIGLHGYQKIRNFVGIPTIVGRFVKKAPKRVIDKKRIIFGLCHFLGEKFSFL